jgi:hypothetical protein
MLKRGTRRIRVPKHARNKHFYVKAAAALLAILLFAFPIASTTVVVLRMPTSITVAADSLIAGETEKLTGCKIGSNIGYRISFAMSGRVQHSKAGFYALPLAISAIKGATNAADAAARFGKTAAPKFRDMMIFERGHTPRDFKELMKDPQPVKVAFVAFEQGVAAYTISTVTPTAKGNDIAVTSHESSCPGDACPDGGGRVIVLGEDQAAIAALSDKNFFHAFSNPASVVKRLVEIEIEAKPDKVGPPISILTIDASGAHWNEKGACSAE